MKIIPFNLWDWTVELGAYLTGYIARQGEDLENKRPLYITLNYIATDIIISF